MQEQLLQAFNIYNAVMNQLSVPQQEWVKANYHNLTGFVATDDGKAALQMLLEGLWDYSSKLK